ncbi:3'-5' exonuclease [Nocardia puris]|uniref:DNA polymerase-3 subunit epsilon n=1 Tax=Nocardia puris TaxID=208602 RepID=A0A366DQW0_9NOCA|nr:3'-5' exonuclease [Nocardia puris]RBO92487.1 DNA polymerase-3 subunit epsilon [Nocardia puris]
MTRELSFAALDVETANPKRGSICAIGVTVVQDGVRVASRSWLCRPPAPVSDFAPLQVRIHGITPNAVAGEPSFAQRWPEVLSVIDGLPVVAHNADFDISAVTQACGHSGIPLPSWDYGCTKVWSQRTLGLPDHKLKTVANRLGVRVDHHHHAGDDARVAAEIAVGLATLTSAENLPDLARACGTRLGRMSPSGVRGCR